MISSKVDKLNYSSHECTVGRAKGPGSGCNQSIRRDRKHDTITSVKMETNIEKQGISSQNHPNLGVSNVELVC